MKHTRIIILLAAAMATIGSAASCISEKNTPDVGAIHFGVSSVYGNGPASRTEYSGKDQNNAGISSSSSAERIDWLSTDKIRIACNQATIPESDNKFADYSVIPSDTKEDETHGATLAPVGEPLYWGTASSYNFFAVYPSPLQNDEAGITVTNSSATITGKIPATQNATLAGKVFKPVMDYAYMYAVTSGIRQGDKVQLNFRPLVTTLEFTLLTRANDPITATLTSVTLSSTQTSVFLAGAFEASVTTAGLTPLTASDISDGSNAITISLGSGVTLSTTEEYTVTFLTLPMDQTQLTLTLNFNDGSKRTLQLKDNGSWMTVSACRKSYVWKLDAPDSVVPYTYVFDASDPTLTYNGTSTATSVTSYRYPEGNPDRKQNVPWTVQGYYTSESDANNKTNVKTLSQVFMTSLSPAAGSGSVTGESISIGYPAATPTSSSNLNLPNLIRERLRSNTGAYVKRGSSSSYWNLSNPVDGAMNNIVETANCYIVNAPGYYCFPLVYGNGVKNNSSTVGSLANNFVDYKNNKITKPDLPKPSEAFIVWEEKNVIDVTGNWNVTFSNEKINGYYWCYLHVKDNIDQGCAVIAVADGSGVMWSWMIWMTDYVPKNYPAYNSDPDLTDIYCANATFMPRNLGWVESGTSASGTTYAQATAFVRLEQVGTDNYRVIKIDRPYYWRVNSGFNGHSPYYQWGRKDPSIPHQYDGSTSEATTEGGRFQDTIYKNNSYSFWSSPSVQGDYTPMEYKWLILNPHIHFGQYAYYLQSTSNGAGGGYNWWHYGANSADTRTATQKTIYDPCPVGYTVPKDQAFAGFSSSEVYTSYLHGHYFNAPDDETHPYIFFPAAGSRAPNTANIESNDYYWTCGSSSTVRAYTMSYSGILQTHYDLPAGRNTGASIRPAQEGR